MEKKDTPKILIVDDCSKNIQVVAGILRTEGYNISYAKSGNAALEKVMSVDFDLILLDIIMPGMNGFEVCEKLKSNSKTAHIPVIFLTGNVEPESLAKGFEVGGVDYLTKPFDGRELLIRANTHIKLQRAQQNLEISNKKLTETISENEAQKHELKIMNLKLVELNATKDKFFSIIAHDLKNPFGAILGLTKLLIEKDNTLETIEISELHSAIHEATVITYELLENLLDWSSSQTGSISFEPKEIDILKIVQDNILLSSNKAKEKEIKVSRNISEKLKNKKQFAAYADYNMVTTILRNLIYNALKFTYKQGKIEINILPYQEEKKEFIAIEVVDNGMGVSKIGLEKLFKINMKYSTPGTSQEQGTGLGLLLCKEFVERNGGKIWIESELGKGCKLTFTLPISLR